MNKHYFKQTIFPCVLLSALAGAFTGVLIFIFKIIAKLVIELSSDIYMTVRSEPRYFLLILGAAAIVGIISYTVTHYIPSCKGGGIPTAVVILRGYLPFEWMTTLVGMFGSSIITFGMGVPLGNEGPSVQMGCAVGRATVNTFGKKNRAWDRYIMTGGASGGFAAATCAPLTGILFAFEEVHRRFSPIIFMSVVSSVAASFTVTSFLCEIFDTEAAIFDYTVTNSLPLKYLFAAMLTGMVSGFSAILFARLYRITDKIMNGVFSESPGELKVISVFLVTAIFGFISPSFIGSGHDVICDILFGRAPVWYLLMFYLAVRTLLLLFANTAGITGGIFIPSLAFGAMIGSLTAKLTVSLGLLPSRYAPIIVIVGMTSFLAASSKIPMTAIAFSLEALSGFTNILPIVLGTAVSYILAELANAKSLSDSVVESKIHSRAKGREHFVIDAHYTVTRDSFAAGKEIRDVLLPPDCVIVSMEKKNAEVTALSEGDILHLRYKTFEHQETYAYLVSIFGKQPSSKMQSVHGGDENYALPEI